MFAVGFRIKLTRRGRLIAGLLICTLAAAFAALIAISQFDSFAARLLAVCIVLPVTSGGVVYVLSGTKYADEKGVLEADTPWPLRVLRDVAGMSYLLCAVAVFGALAFAHYDQAPPLIMRLGFGAFALLFLIFGVLGAIEIARTWTRSSHS